MHYKEKSKDIFNNYIKTWYKIKTEASGWPKWCECGINFAEMEQNKLNYLKVFEEKEEIKLDRENVKYNSGMRYIAKLMLNSLWGKLAQRPNQSKTELISEYAKYWDLMNDPLKEITGEIKVSDYSVLINWKYKSDE